jgi:hypothetical protein
LQLLKLAENGGIPMKRKCLISLLAAVMTLSACGIAQLTIPESQTGIQEESQPEEPTVLNESSEEVTSEPDSQLSESGLSGDSSTSSVSAEVEGTDAYAAFTDVFRNMSERTMYFSSGAGGWSTDLEIGEDGTFTGHYHDSDMGDTGDGYPNGTCYICDFTGRFVITDQIDESIYRMKIEEIASEKEILTEWIDDGIRYIGAAPYGLSGGEEFLLYLPGLPLSKLTDDGISWYRMPRGIGDSELPETLPCYGIYNTATGDAFYSG